ncbi:MAG: ELM1/GtrOC1 family putative glycosyltransferase [Hyphomicrobium sp.]
MTRLGQQKEALLPHQRPEPPANARRTRVLLISDGRPGHYRQSEGVVAALARRGPVDVDRVELATTLPIPKGLIPKLARLLPPAWLVRFVHGRDPAGFVRPDIIVSSGGSTVGANVAFSRLLGVPNVFSGSTRGFPPAAFSLVLTPYLSAATAPNIVAGPKPTPFDPDRVPPPRRLATGEDLRGARVSLLVGGPTPYADFEAGDWARLASLVAGLVAEWGCRATVVTSPRTPDEAYAEILPVAEASGGAVSVIDYRTAGPGSIEAAFDCDLVLITSDSMSMMTEAAVSRRPAIALAPAKVGPNKDDEAVAGLAAARWLAVLPLAATGPATLADSALALEPIAHNHLDRLAGLVTASIEGNPLPGLS